MLRLCRGYRELTLLGRGGCHGTPRLGPKPRRQEKAGASAGRTKLGGWREDRVKNSRIHDVRRSAVQVPEHSPPAAVQVPVPLVDEMRPVPLALLSPLETVTTKAPLSPTDPETLNDALPA